MKAAVQRLRAAWRNAARVRIMTWALLASVLCGATGFLQPVDDLIRSLRFAVRDVPADGTVAAVGIDDKSVAALGGRWPWSRAVDADLIEALKRAGAKRIVFDRALVDADTPENDAKIIATFKRYPGDIFLGTGFQDVRKGKGQGRLMPLEIYRPHVSIVDFATWTNPIGQSALAPMESRYGEVRYPSISTVLANRKPVRDAMTRPDYAIRHSSFPYASVNDVIAGRADDVVRGRDVIIGLASKSLGDTKYLPAQGEAPGLFNHAIATQTLKRGLTINAGWEAPLGFALLAALGMLLLRRDRVAIGIGTSATALLCLAPLWLDSRNISTEVTPAALLLGMVMVQDARRRMGIRKSRTNEGSGLANVVALREVPSVAGVALVAARVENYSAIIASFPRDVERAIVLEIAGRLRLGNSASEIYQADDGVFYWLATHASVLELGDHLEGLRAVMGSAIQVLDRRVDIALAFGVDVDSLRPMASRIGSALLCADEALKAGSRWKLYDAARSDDAAWELSIASEIDRGLDAQQFWLAFQPKLDLATGEIAGAEVLARWRHPDRGDISPGEFIPAAERTGRIHRLTDYMIDRAIDAAGLLARVGRYKLAVNISSPTLALPGFAATLLERVRARGVDPSMLVLEITESVLLSSDDITIAHTLDQLRADGFGLSIDDFGTGFSSLDYVRRIPAHEMKIDQSFVRKLVMSDADRVIVESIIDMAHHLGRSVVAEGVEDAATLDRLRELGCDQVQGFHIGRPMPLSDFTARLRADQTRFAA